MKHKDLFPATKLPDIQHTVPEVFIFESLNEADESEKRYEGQLLANMLTLAGKNPKYYYFQSVDEIPYLLGLFRQSRYRYLHISAHASSTHVGFTNDQITYLNFAKLFEGHLKLRRLFFSACKVGNEKFVETFAKHNKGMHSIMAPAENIRFDHAAAIWSAFYISMFTDDYKAMKSSTIHKKITALTSLFPVDFFLAYYKAKSDIWENNLIRKS